MRFLQDITFGQYVRRTSFIHRLDPRAKLLSLAVILPLIFTSRSTLSLSALTLAAFISIMLTRIPPSFILKGLKQFLWLFLFAAVFHAFFTPGEPLSYLSSVSYEGMEEGILIMCRLLLAILFSTLLTLTTTPLELTAGLERLLSPLKRIGVPVSDLSMMMLVVIRFIPILKIEVEGIIKAQRGRGIDFAGGFSERAKVVPAAPYWSRLYINSFKRTVTMSKSLSTTMVANDEVMLTPSFSPMTYALTNSPILAGRRIFTVKTDERYHSTS